MARKTRHSGAMHVVTNTIRRGDREYRSQLLRRSFREGGKVKKETLANLSHLPDEAIELIRGALRGEHYVPADRAFAIERSLPAGHVQAALAMARRLELSRLLDRQPSKQRDLCLAMICQRAIAPASKLQTVRVLEQSTLADELGVEGIDEDDLYAAMDWLLARQGRIEDRLARRHLSDGELVLYDVSSSYFEGRSCPLARRGYSRDGRRGTPQIIYGLLCDKPGRPIAVEVFSGELHDDKTLPTQIQKLKARFGLATVIVVSDRGMVTKANLELLRDTDGVGWITALKAPQIKQLAASGALQLSLFDERNLAEIAAPEDYPGERLVVCRNPLVAAERTRKRDDLMQATERDLQAIADRVARGTLAGADQIGLAVGPAVKRYRMKKHFELEIADTDFSFERKQAQIAAEAALDGIYVLRTSVATEELPSAEVVRSYKGLEQVERAFGTLKGPELQIRPIHHHLEHRVRAHVLLCTLAYYLTWHLRQAWAPLLFKDEQPPIPADPVTKATRSPAAERKAQTKRTTTGDPCHSYKSLVDELATQTRNTIRLAGSTTTFDKL
ncbi:MAG TPA: IS1634 family transposase, partial [Thermoleophilaceae bacterium]|nr:IS1634 family transposase [Thermoleophilaceae bacterium]